MFRGTLGKRKPEIEFLLTAVWRPTSPALSGDRIVGIGFPSWVELESQVTPAIAIRLIRSQSARDLQIIVKDIQRLIDPRSQ
jgi:hypothetical protein